MAGDIFSSTPQMSARQKFAAMLLQQAGDTGPVKHPLQAVARALAGGMGGHLGYQAEQEDKQAGQEMFSALPGLGGGTPAAAQPSPAAPAPAAGSSPYSGAISSIESGGRYDALGPVTKSGDRAVGKYQIMGANVGPWTEQHYGQRMTPDEFARNPDAQEAVFKGQFGNYVNKYGPEGAAKAWFAGEGGMNNPNARDQLGTSVSAYANKFNRALGPQVASLDPGAGTGPAAAPQPPGGVQVAQAPQPGATPPAAARASVNIPPEVQQTIQRLGKDPRTRGQAWQLYLQYAKPSEQWVQERNPNGSIYLRNTTTGDMKALEKSDVLPQQAVDQKISIAAAGKPQITVDQRGENEFSKEAGKLQAKRYNELADEAPKAKQMLSDVQTLQTLGGIIGTGKEAQVKAMLGPYADALGIKVEGLPEIQAYEAIVNRVAPSLRVPGSGAQSDYELKNFLKSLPSLGNTPDGNALASRVMEGLYNNKLKAAEIGADALNGDITRKEAEKRLRELPDPMQEYREFVKKNPGATVRPNDEGGWTVINGVKIREKR